MDIVVICTPRDAHETQTHKRAPACFGMIARTWRYMAQCTWLYIQQGCWPPCMCVFACAFSTPPTTNLTAWDDLFLMACPHSQTHTVSHQNNVFSVKLYRTRPRWINNWWKCWTPASTNDPSDTCVHVACAPPSNFVSLTVLVNHASVPWGIFFFNIQYDVFKGWTWHCLGFWLCSVIHPGASRLQLQSYPLWARSHSSAGVPHTHTHTYLKVQKHKGDLCNWVHTRLLSGSSRLLSVWWKEAASPWSLASSSAILLSPILLTSPFSVFHTLKAALSATISHLFFHTPAHLPSRVNTHTKLNEETCHCSALVLRASFASSPSGLFLATLLHQHKMRHRLLQLSRNLIMQPASHSES